jgi:hypothetical protein
MVPRGDAMTPTLLGRWQTRLALFGAIALPVSLVFAWMLGPGGALAPEPVLLATLTLIVGLVLDGGYDQAQRYSWDQDWPFALFLVASLAEFALALTIVRLDLIPFVDACRLARIDRVTRSLVCVDYSLPLAAALWQAGATTAISLALVAGFGQTLFPRWRFKGCEFGRLNHESD